MNETIHKLAAAFGQLKHQYSEQELKNCPAIRKELLEQKKGFLAAVYALGITEVELHDALKELYDQ